jgi:hypothetical protein
MSKNPTLLEHFRSFCFLNNVEDFEEALEYFTLFGGMGWRVDTSKSLLELIESKLLKNYTYIHGDITKITDSNKTSHALLSGIAMGDRRVHSALKRARISREDAQRSIDTLEERGMLEIENSLESPPSDERIDDKLNFTTPFMRFWFAFISPFFKGIKEGNYEEVKRRFNNRQNGFSNLILEKLSYEVLQNSFKDDHIKEVGSYWDRNVEIDILAKTASGKIVAGVCKFSKAKANKTELTKLKEKCAIAELTPDIYVIFSKSGFSNELKSEKGENLKLFTMKNYKKLIQNLNKEDLLIYSGKKY